jgi:hypothetical protein
LAGKLSKLLASFFRLFNLYSFIKQYTSMKKILGSILILTSIILLASCNKETVGNSNSNDYAGLLAFNLAPDKTVGFAIAAASFTNAPLAFTNYTGGYQPVYPGGRTVSAYDFPIGTTIASKENNFVAGKYYSVYLVGRNGNYQTIISDDNTDSLNAGSGNAYIRYINAITDSSNPVVRIATRESEAINEPAAFGALSAFKQIAAIDVNISVNNGSTINSSRTITAEANKVYTVLLVGVPGSAGADSVQIKFIQNGSLQ